MSCPTTTLTIIHPRTMHSIEPTMVQCVNRLSTETALLCWKGNRSTSAHFSAPVQRVLHGQHRPPRALCGNAAAMLHQMRGRKNAHNCRDVVNGPTHGRPGELAPPARLPSASLLGSRWSRRAKRRFIAVFQVAIGEDRADDGALATRAAPRCRSHLGQSMMRHPVPWARGGGRSKDYLLLVICSLAVISKPYILSLL
jgi:hypothetical protein